jgi:hypothetical protein
VRLPWRAALLHRQFSHHDISGKYAPGLSRPHLATVRILIEASSARLSPPWRQRSPTRDSQLWPVTWHDLQWI